MLQNAIGVLLLSWHNGIGSVSAEAVCRFNPSPPHAPRQQKKKKKKKKKKRKGRKRGRKEGKTEDRPETKTQGVQDELSLQSR